MSADFSYFFPLYLLSARGGATYISTFLIPHVAFLRGVHPEYLYRDEGAEGVRDYSLPPGYPQRVTPLVRGIHDSRGALSYSYRGGSAWSSFLISIILSNILA